MDRRGGQCQVRTGGMKDAPCSPYGYIQSSRCWTVCAVLTGYLQYCTYIPHPGSRPENAICNLQSAIAPHGGRTRPSSSTSTMRSRWTMTIGCGVESRIPHQTSFHHFTRLSRPSFLRSVPIRRTPQRRRTLWGITRERGWGSGLAKGRRPSVIGCVESFDHPPSCIPGSKRSSDRRPLRMRGFLSSVHSMPDGWTHIPPARRVCRLRADHGGPEPRTRDGPRVRHIAHRHAMFHDEFFCSSPPRRRNG